MESEAPATWPGVVFSQNLVSHLPAALLLQKGTAMLLDRSLQRGLPGSLANSKLDFGCRPHL